MQFKSTYLALAVLAGMGLALGACSSSSSDDSPPQSMMLDLGGLAWTGNPEAGDVITIPAGESRTMFGITATCPAGGEACVVTITDDGANYTGGKPTLMAAVMPEPEPTPYETAQAGIAAATTAAAAQAAYDAVEDDVTAAQGAMLQAAVDARIAALNMMARAAAQKTALMTAAGMVDTSDLSTAEAITAANADIADLKAALAAATDVSDADKAMYQTQLAAAEAAVMTAQNALDTQGRMMAQRMAITDAVTAARTAVGAVNDDSNDDDVTAADDAIAALQAAIDGAADLPEGDADVAVAQGTLDTLELQLASAKDSRQMAMDAADEERRMTAINNATDMLAEKEAALEALADDATDQQKHDAQRMVEAAANALRDALRMNGGSDEDIETAIRKSAEAKIAADALQATITAAANAKAASQMAAINEAKMTLSDAEEALAELGEDATDEEKRDAHRAVQNAADNLVEVLEENEGTADQIAAATMKRDSAEMMADDLTDPIEIANQRKAITDALTTLATTVAAVDDEATDAKVTAADTALTAARNAIKAATQLPEAEKRAHTLLVNAHESTLTSSKTSRQIAMKAKDDEKRDMEKAEVTKMAKTKEKAIMTEAAGESASLIRPFDGGADIADGAPGAADATTKYELSIKHTGSAVEVTVRDERNLAANDPKFEMSGGKLVRTIGEKTETIVVGSDIKAPTPMPFGKVHTLNAGDDPLTTVTDNDSLNLTESGDGNHLMHVDLGMGKAEKGLTKSATFAKDDDDSTTAVNGQRRGRFDGAMGTYTCLTETSEAACSATVNDKGVVTVLVGEWNFKPDADVTVKVADDDYTHWGFWVRSSKEMGYEAVQTFFGGTMPYGVAGGSLVAERVSELAGTASYVGDAIGVYVHKMLDDNFETESMTAGTFDADVELTANFGGNAVSAANQFTIDGVVKNFDLSGGEANNWALKLGRADFSGRADGAAADAAPGTSFDNVFSGTTSSVGGSSAMWNGMFYGEAKGNTPAPANAVTRTDHPSAVAGEFNGNFLDGNVAGAFGATKE